MEIRRFQTLNKYIGSEFSFSFLVSFLFYFFIFLLNQLLLMAQGILTKGIPLGSVLLLMFYSLPSFITLSAPFATLTAALMTYGRFSSDNEILAMQSAGFKRFSIFKPVFVSGIVIFLVSFFVNDILLSAGTKAFQKLWLELSLTHPGLELESFSIRKFKQSMLVTGVIDKQGIHPMIIIERDNDGNQSTTMARLASPRVRGNTGAFPWFHMSDVFSLIPNAQNLEEWTWANADSMDYRLLSDMSSMFDQQSGPLSMRVLDIRNVIREKKARHKTRLDEYWKDLEKKRFSLSLEYARVASGNLQQRQTSSDILMQRATTIRGMETSRPVDHSLQIWTLEFYQKFAIPFAAIPFVFLAFPLGLSARRSGRATGFFIGLLMTSFYWSLLVLGRLLGLRTEISPFLVMIVPDILLLGVGILLYFKRFRI